MTKTDYTGIILAGGHSRRMGQDKGTTLWRGKPFVEHVMQTLSSVCVETTIVSSRTEHQKYDALPDIYPNKGPLGGLVTGLKHARQRWSIVLSADIPLIKSPAVEFLIRNHNKDADATILSYGGYPKPLVGIYHKRCADIFLSHLINDRLKLMDALDDIDLHYVSVPYQYQWMLVDVNTPETLVRLQKSQCSKTEMAE